MLCMYVVDQHDFKHLNLLLLVGVEKCCCIVSTGSMVPVPAGMVPAAAPGRFNDSTGTVFMLYHM